MCDEVAGHNYYDILSIIISWYDMYMEILWSWLIIKFVLFESKNFLKKE